VNSVPVDSFDSTVIEPPGASMILSTMQSPRPRYWSSTRRRQQHRHEVSPALLLRKQLEIRQVFRTAGCPLGENQVGLAEKRDVDLTDALLDAIAPRGIKMPQAAQ
jgi:hypothetical protein